MAKQIKSSDLFQEEDIFRSIRESAEKTITTLEKFKQEAVESAAALKKAVQDAGFSDSKSINDFITNTKKLNDTKEKTIAIDKQLAELRKLNAQAEREETNAKKANITLQEKEAKAREKVARETKKQASEYSQLSAKTRDLKNQSKDLAAQMLKLEDAGQRNTAEYRKLAKEYNNVTAAAAKYDQELKQIDARVGDNFRNVGNYQSALGGLQNVMGQLGIAFGIGTVVQGAGKTIIEFDQAIADLVSITGAGGKDLEFFKEQAISLGKEVDGGASAVIEAYKLIGSAKPELLENADALNAVTESAITLSQASGMELPAAATALTDAMNQFGAPAEEASRFIDALANGALYGSAEIPQVTEALLKFGAVARTANVSLEESTGLIEALAEKGLKGAEAGTALRNVMLKLNAPDALPREAKKRLDDLGISFADLQDTSKPFSQRLESLKPLLKDNATLVKVFGTENAVAATNLISNTDRIADLTEKMYTQGTASKQAGDRTETLSHALTQLKGAWDEVILGFTSGEGTTQILVQGIKFLANNLGTLISLVGKIVVAWGAYKTIQLSLAAIEKARSFSFAEFGKNLSAQIPMTKAYAEAQKEVGQAAKQSGESVKTAGSALSGIAWVAITYAVIELAQALWRMATNADAAAEAQARFDKTTEGSQKAATERVTKRQKELDDEIKALQRKRNENKITEDQFLKRKQYAINLTQKEIRQDIKAVADRKKANAERIKILEKDIANANEMIQLEPKLANEYGKRIDKMNDQIAQLKANIAGGTVKIEEYKKELQATTEAQKDNNSELTINSNAERENTRAKGDKIPKQKELNTEMEKYNEYLTKQNELLAQGEEFDTTTKIAALDDEIKNLTDDALMLAEGGIVPDTTLLQAKMQERLELEKDLIGERLKLDLQAIDDRYKAESDKAKEQITANYNKLIGQDGLTSEERKKINDQYQAQLAQFDLDELQRNADKELELKNTKKKALQEGYDLDKKFGEENLQLKEDINAKLTEAEQRRLNREAEAQAQAQEKYKKRLDQQTQWAKFAADYFIEQSKRKVEQLDKEISNAEKQQGILQELAANGNINAKESLAEQQRIIDDANRKKAQEERRQQMIQLASSVYATYNQKLAENSEHPLMETMRDAVLLQQFANTLIGQMPTFLEGTEDTGTNGRGVDGKGGFHAILHPNERVVPKSLNEQIGAMSNEQLARIAQEYQTGKIVRGSEAGSSLDLAILVNEMKDLKETIKAKPETNIELGEITSSMMEIVKRTKQGNTLKTNRYKIRK